MILSTVLSRIHGKIVQDINKSIYIDFEILQNSGVNLFKPSELHVGIQNLNEHLLLKSEPPPMKILPSVKVVIAIKTPQR